MPTTITPAPENVSELKLGAVNIRRARGDETLPGGGTLPQGRLSVAATLRRYTDGAGVDGQDLPGISVSDVDAWIGELVAASDPLAAEAIAKFAEVDAALKWLVALRGSQLGLCERPTA